MRERDSLSKQDTKQDSVSLLHFLSVIPLDIYETGTPGLEIIELYMNFTISDSL